MIRRASIGVLAICLAGQAEAESPETEVEPHVRKWGGLVIPTVGASTTDGPGFGVGGELFRKSTDPADRYHLKVTPSLYVNTRFNYANNFIRIDYRTPSGRRWLAQVGHSAWANMRYAGNGGEEVLLVRDEEEIGNRLSSPYAFVSLSVPIQESDWAWTAQAYVRGGFATANPGGLLALDSPLGLNPSVYTDIAGGVSSETKDRWPMPREGWVFEASLSAGGTIRSGMMVPSATLHIEHAHWLPLWKDSTILGARVLAFKTLGTRPFYEADKAGGRWRDELGSEQALSGYGRTRTRGDGAAAVMVELRQRLVTVTPGSADLRFFLSPYAEWGYLFDRFDPGPPLPTVGLSIPILWQQTVQVRPFAALGWRRAPLEAARAPSPQFGVSVLDAL